MECLDVRDRLVALHDGELAPAEAELVHAHLQRCPDCAELSVSLASLDVRAPAIWMTDDVREQIRAAAQRGIDIGLTEQDEGETDDSSAYPSMHIASVALFAIAAVFAAWIQLGDAPTQALQPTSEISVQEVQPASWPPRQEEGWD